MQEDLERLEANLSRRRQARVDFHIHSYASNVTDYYASNSLAIPESYSDPLENSPAAEGPGHGARHAHGPQLDRRRAR